MYPVSECILIFSCQVCPSQHAPDQTTQHSLEFVTETGRQLDISQISPPIFLQTDLKMQ